MNRFWISSYGTHQYSPHKDPHCCVLPIKYGKGFTLKGSSCFVNYGSFCTIHFTSSIWECCQSRRSGKVQCDCVCEGLYCRELRIGVKHKHTRSAMWVTEAVLSELQDHLDWREFSKCCLFARAARVVLVPDSLKELCKKFQLNAICTAGRSSIWSDGFKGSVWSAAESVFKCTKPLQMVFSIISS